MDRDLVAQGLLVSNWGELAAPSVAECALMLILCALRRVTHWPFVMHQQREWPQDRIIPSAGLFGRRVGLHGFGNVARSTNSAANGRSTTSNASPAANHRSGW